MVSIMGIYWQVSAASTSISPAFLPCRLCTLRKFLWASQESVFQKNIYLLYFHIFRVSTSEKKFRAFSKSCIKDLTKSSYQLQMQFYPLNRPMSFPVALQCKQCFFAHRLGWNLMHSTFWQQRKLQSHDGLKHDNPLKFPNLFVECPLRWSMTQKHLPTHYQN